MIYINVFAIQKSVMSISKLPWEKKVCDRYQNVFILNDNDICFMFEINNIFVPIGEMFLQNFINKVEFDACSNIFFIKSW